MHATPTEPRESYCSTRCKRHHNVDVVIDYLITLASTEGLHAINNSELNNLYETLFQRDAPIYCHPKDDVGIQLSYLYFYLVPRSRHHIDLRKKIEICECLEVLRYFLRINTK
jgi:hypothetical protein